MLAQGGHTLPRTVTRHTLLTPAHSRLTTQSLPLDVSSRILASCRRAKITFGHAFAVLSQLAHARILHRQRLRGQISEGEWQERKQQPMNFMGPLNLRPYLSPEWFQGGGSGEVCVLVTCYSTKLPFMPTSGRGSEHWEDGAPPFSDLLSKERFLHRSRIVKKQCVSYMQHPLFLELVALWNEQRGACAKETAGQWRDLQRKGDSLGEAEDKSAVRCSSASNIIFANSGSSMGNVSTAPIVTAICVLMLPIRAVGLHFPFSISAFVCSFRASEPSISRYGQFQLSQT